MDLRYPCPGCERENRAELAEEAAVLSCAHCDYVGLLPLDWLSPAREVVRCPICGGPDLFRDRRIDPRATVLLLLAGLAFSPLTRFVSLAAAAAVWLLAWPVARERLVCYRCSSAIRGHRRRPDQRPFDARTRAQFVTRPRLAGPTAAPPPTDR